MTEVVFCCCYCEDPIEEDEMTGVAMYDHHTGEMMQSWFAHERCFRERLSPDFNFLPPSMEEWEDCEHVEASVDAQGNVHLDFADDMLADLKELPETSGPER